MNEATHRWAAEVRVSVEVLKRIRDEARVQGHLATLEAKARFLELQRRLNREQRVARKNLSELAANFRAFKDEVVRAARRTT
ncbi:MAG: hypothetical protein H6Q89_4051 [Myxococcaceae bacterium]|nr:hypothetical protein [Myxococcaceae bacterium]